MITQLNVQGLLVESLQLAGPGSRQLLFEWISQFTEEAKNILLHSHF